MTIIRPEAELELEEAYDWLEQQVPGLGEKLGSQFDEVIARIEQFPEMYGVTCDDIRVATLRQFAYFVCYRIVGNDLVITAVMHNARNPLLWQDRH